MAVDLVKKFLVAVIENARSLESGEEILKNSVQLLLNQKISKRSYFSDGQC